MPQIVRIFCILFMSITIGSVSNAELSVCNVGVLPKLKHLLECQQSESLWSCSPSIMKAGVGAGAAIGASVGLKNAYQSIGKDVERILADVKKEKLQVESDLRKLDKQPEIQAKQIRETLEKREEKLAKLISNSKAQLEINYKETAVRQFSENMKSQFPHLFKAGVSASELNRVIEANPRLVEQAMATGRIEKILDSYRLEQSLLEGTDRMAEIKKISKTTDTKFIIENERRRLLTDLDKTNSTLKSISGESGVMKRLGALTANGAIQSGVPIKSAIKIRFVMSGIAGALAGSVLTGGVLTAVDLLTISPATACSSIEESLMETDVSNGRCAPAYRIGPNVDRFLNLSEEMQKDYFKRFPSLCAYYQKLLNDQSSAVTQDYSCLNSEHTVATHIKENNKSLSMKIQHQEKRPKRIEIDGEHLIALVLDENGLVMKYEYFIRGRWISFPADAQLPLSSRPAIDYAKSQLSPLRLQMENLNSLISCCYNEVANCPKKAVPRPTQDTQRPDVRRDVYNLQ